MGLLRSENMTATNGDFNPFDPTGMLKGVRDANMAAMAKMMVDFVNTDAYAESTGAMLDAWLTSSGPFRKVMENSTAQALAQLNLPSRDDVARIAERLTNIEMRLDDLEAKLDDTLAKIGESQS
jgi:polyhydroxyalkanoic acid synthase PhaR subunit